MFMRNHDLLFFPVKLFRGERINCYELFSFLSRYCKRTSGFWKPEVLAVNSCDKLEWLRSASSPDNESGKQVPEGCCVNGNARGHLCFTGSLFRDAHEHRVDIMLPLWKVDWERERMQVHLRILIREKYILLYIYRHTHF